MTNNNNHAPVALITGAAKRVGAAIAEALHAKGYNIIIHCRHSTQEAFALSEFFNHNRSGSAHVLTADLSVHQEVITLAQQALSAFGRIDVLINNASSFYATPIALASESDWDALFSSNVKAPYFLASALADELKARQGAIINISDIYARHPLKQFSIYSMAKAANEMMTKSLAIELAPSVRVNGIAPGAIMWPANETDDHQKQQSILEKIPLERIGDTSDIAKAVLFLLRDAPYINGQILTLDGGRSLRV
jgi:pteridine reductase